MTSISTTQKTSKRSLTFNKSFLLSIFIHLIIIFGITLTTFYKLPILKDSPVINVKFANSNEDYLGSMSNSIDSIINYSQSDQEMFEMSTTYAHAQQLSPYHNVTDQRIT